MNALYMQVRREIWEHRGLWIAPLVAAGLLVVGSVFGSFASRGVGTELVGSRMVFATAVGFAVFLTVVGSLVIFAYLLDCLYAERKDRSILFWKSLPVSDAMTVLTKFGVAMVIVPLSIWLLGMITHLISSGVLLIRQPAFGPLVAGDFFAAWFAAQGRLLAALFVAALWYAPVASYLMLASAYARRAPLMVAMLPLVVSALGERIIFDTTYVWSFLANRLFAWNLGGPSSMDTWRDLLAPLAEPALWLGLAAAAGMLYIVIRMRRYRDDT